MVHLMMISPKYLSWNCTLTLTTPNPLKSSKGHLFWKKISTVGNWYFDLFKWGQNYYLARSTGQKCWIWKINENAWCILKIRACFQKCTGGFWRILEDSGRFLARIPWGLGLMFSTIMHCVISYYRDDKVLLMLNKFILIFSLFGSGYK